MAETRGTWSLSEAWAEKTADEWAPISDVFIDRSEESHGFFMGGTNKSDFDKIVYSTDTLSTPTSNLGTPSTPNLVVANSDTHAYIAGSALNPSYVSYRHTLSSDTLALCPYIDSSSLSGGPSSGGIYGQSDCVNAAGTKTTGYYFRSDGYERAKVDFASETKYYLTPSTSWPQGITGYSGVASNQETAAIGPSYTSGNSGSRVIRFTFSTDTHVDYGWTLVSNNNEQGGLDPGADGTSGFMIGGLHGSRVERVDFISDVATVLPGSNMAGSRNTSGCNSQGTTTGYIAGGSTFTPSPPSYKGEKMPFSTMTMAQMPGVPASLGRTFVKSYSGSSHNLPSVLRNDSSYESWSDGAEFVVESDVVYKSMGNTSAAPGSSGWTNPYTEQINLRSGRQLLPASNSPVSMQGGASFSTNTHGIAATGQRYYDSQPSSNMYSYVVKFTYASGVMSTTSMGNYPGGGWSYSAGFGGPSHGYMAGGTNSPGGNPGGRKDTVSKYDFSTDTWSSMASLSKSRARSANFQNSEFALLAGGWNADDTDKMPWATETWAAEPSLQGTPGWWSANGYSTSYNNCGNEENGYYAGQTSTYGQSFVTRMNYSTSTRDNVAYLVGTSPSYKWGGMAGAGNSKRGVFMGGGTYNPDGINSNICTFNYGNESLSLEPGGTLQTGGMGLYTFGPHKVGQKGRTKLSFVNSKSIALNPAITVPNHGYFSSGDPSPATLPNKLNFSNDTASAVPGQTYRLRQGNAFSSPTHWYVTGGFTTASYPPGNSETVKIQYSNDTVTNGSSYLPSHQWTSDGSRNRTPFSDHENGSGYLSGGYYPYNWSPTGSTQPATSNVLKLKFATDTWMDCPWAYIISEGGWMSAFGRSSGIAGYRSGGSQGVTFYPYSGPTPKLNNQDNFFTDKLVFSNETWIRVPSAPLDATAGYSFGSAATDSAFFCRQNTVNKLYYGTETIELQPSGLVGNSYRAGSSNCTRNASSSTHGYGGGLASGYKSDMSKYDFSTSTDAALTSYFTYNSRYNVGSSVQEDAGGYSASPNLI
tara:strand:+ start:30 stop:3140 length:3111 start_codon:yes stop_codon:yes gene_type:complete